MSGVEPGRAAGTRLGPYEILGRIAAGGMGEVYRARDPRLARDVALKVLSDQFAADRQRLQRFEREARVVSALNHPNIVTVFEIGQSETLPFIAMELVEGQSLRQLLRAGGLPLRKLLDLATQVAEGLARAHEAGVVHRDLKPDNVMVTPDGGVKILDFGLAKLTRSFLERGAEPEDGTLPLPTEPGVLIGTVRYMAPEQASGQPADFRSDQFAFGSVLYEMATGEPAFQRDTTVDTLSAILHDEPRPLTETAPKTPTPLRWVIERCLAKDPADRYAATRDLAHDLATIRQRLSEVSGIGERVPLPAARRPRRPLRVFASLAIVAAAVLAGMWTARGRRSAEPPSFRQLTFRPGMVGPARFSPDGQSFIYSASWQGRPEEIFVQRSGSVEPRAFGMEGARLLAISNSGEMAIALRSRLGEAGVVGTLARMNISTNAGPRELLSGISWADWSPDGTALAIVGEREGRSTLEYPVGRVIYRATAGYLSNPRISRDGRQVAFLDHPVRGNDMGRIMLVDEAGVSRVLSPQLETLWGLAWSPNGRELWFTGANSGVNRELRAVTLSGSQRVIARVMGSTRLEDVSGSGRLLVAHDLLRQRVFVYTPRTQREEEITWLDVGVPKAITPDGSRVLFVESGEGGGPGFSTFLRSTDGSPAIRLGEGEAMSLSPEGDRALAIVRKETGQSIAVYPTGAGETRSIAAPGLDIQRAAWLPGSDRVLLSAGENRHGRRLYLLDLNTGRYEPISPDGFAAVTNAISPDGRRAVVRGADQDYFLLPLDGSEPSRISPMQRDEILGGWSQDGDHLFVATSGGLPRRVDLLELATGKRVPWRELPADGGTATIGAVSVAPDGRSYVYSYTQQQGDLFLVEGVR